MFSLPVLLTLGAEGPGIQEHVRIHVLLSEMFTCYIGDLFTCYIGELTAIQQQ